MNEQQNRRQFLEGAITAGVVWALPGVAQSAAAAEAEACIQWGLDFFRRGELQASVVSFTRAIELDPKSEQALDGRSIANDALGDSERAIADRTEIIRLNSCPVNFQMRGIFAMEHDAALAIADFTERIRLEPTHPEAHGLRGMVYEQQGRYDLALADYTTAQALDLEDPEGWTEDVARIRRFLR